MKTKQLGNSDLFITPVGVGAWAIGGGGWEFAWGAQDDSDSVAAIRAALDAGVNWIDTAAVYGLGHSEEIIARALEGAREPALRLHQVQHGLGRAPANRPQPQG
jgi:aryl-alcohol dehydrogenase-like predicted oxidoreductase